MTKKKCVFMTTKKHVPGKDNKPLFMTTKMSVRDKEVSLLMTTKTRLQS